MTLYGPTKSPRPTGNFRRCRRQTDHDAAETSALLNPAVGRPRTEIERGMKLMGVTSLDQLTPDMVRRRA